MQAIIQPFSAARWCPACFALGGAGAVGAGAALWYGGAKALIVGAVALAALALLAIAYGVSKVISWWKQRPVEPTNFRETFPQGRLRWEMKLRNVDVVVREVPYEGLYAFAMDSLTQNQAIDDQTSESLKSTLSNKVILENDNPRHLLLPVVFNNRSGDDLIGKGVKLAFSAVKAFVKEGGDAERITILFQDYAGINAMFARPTPEFVGIR